MTKRPLRSSAGLGALALTSCLAGSGCTTVGNPAGTSLEDSVPGSRSGMMALAAQNAVASPSPTGPIAALPESAGAVSDTRTKRYVNGLRQDISLTGGVSRGIRNSITAAARTSKQETLDEAAPLYKPTESAIRSEIGAQFPKISMQVSDREFGNAYGPYGLGLALGRGSGEVHCLYMWQWIDENRIPSNAGVMGPVSVRVRLCQDKTNFDAMKSLVDNLTIGASPRGTGTTVSGEVRILPLPAEGSERPAAGKSHRMVHRHRQAGKAERDSASVAMAPAPQTVLVAPASSRGTSPLAPPSKTSIDLPPQAYLGPKGSAAMRTSSAKTEPRPAP